MKVNSITMFRPLQIFCRQLQLSRQILHCAGQDSISIIRAHMPCNSQAQLSTMYSAAYRLSTEHLCLTTCKGQQLFWMLDQYLSVLNHNSASTFFSSHRFLIVEGELIKIMSTIKLFFLFPSFDLYLSSTFESTRIFATFPTLYLWWFHSCGTHNMDVH